MTRKEVFFPRARVLSFSRLILFLSSSAERKTRGTKENLTSRFYSYTFIGRRYKPDVDVYQVPASGFYEFRVDVECASERFR